VTSIDRPFMTMRPVAQFPRGWFAVVPSAALAPGRTHPFDLADRHWVAFRTENGEARVAYVRCAHLGGRLDRAGFVQGEQLVCGLHSYSFGVDGRPAGRHPKACPLKKNLEMLPTVERHGMIFAHYDDVMTPPRFELPELDEEGWPGWVYRHMDVQTRPELVMQDLADPLHFYTVHRYANVQVEHGPAYRDHEMKISVRFDWDTGLPGPLRNLPSRFESECHGLGYQRTTVTALGGLIQARFLVLPTPIDGDSTRIYLGSAARWSMKFGSRAGKRLAEHLTQRFMLWAFSRDVARDAVLWEHQPTHLRPSLAPDENIHAFRTWARGFKGV
jgi:phenylpropionate dioxygenase-like ring-hydroxylating dioxygenase large terminal subunit